LLKKKKNNLDILYIKWAMRQSNHIVGANIVGTNIVGTNIVGANIVGANIVGANTIIEDALGIIGTVVV
jgi:hypothetical protein